MENNQELPAEFRIDQETGTNMNEIGKWAGFLAIVGFIMLALMIVFSFSILFITGPIPAGPYGQSISRGVIFFLYILMAVVYFFPTWFLFRFADLMRKALKKADHALFGEAIRYLKSFFVFIGILTIIGLAIMFVAMLIGLAMGKMF